MKYSADLLQPQRIRSAAQQGKLRFVYIKIGPADFCLPNKTRFFQIPKIFRCGRPRYAEVTLDEFDFRTGTHVWQVPLAGGPARAVTSARGNHGIVLGENGRVMLHTFSLFD